MKKYLKFRKYTFKNIHEHPRASLVLHGLANLQRSPRLAVSKPRVKCPGVNPRYANAPPPGRATLGNAPGLPGGGWALLELTDALHSTSILCIRAQAFAS